MQELCSKSLLGSKNSSADSKRKIMICYNSAGILFIASLFVVAASGYEYGSDVQGDVESRLLLSDMFYDYDNENENAAAMREICATETSKTRCQTAELGSDYPVHVCQTSDLKGLCYYSDVPTCCKIPSTSVFKCKSVTNVQVGEKKASVTHYRNELSGEICVSFSPDVKACDEKCKKGACTKIGCVKNQVCDSNGDNCRCKEGFSEESDCCKCKKGYSRAAKKCKKPRPRSCNKAQIVYFFIDATSSNKFLDFCPLIYTMQLLEVAFTSSQSSTKVGAVLFSNKAKKIGPSPVFSVSTSCHDAVQKLDSLVSEYGICLDKSRDYRSKTYPSMCGEGTSAVQGLKEIYKTISKQKNPGVVLMLTDGKIEDPDMDRKAILNKFKEKNIKIIGAGIGGIQVRKRMKLYTSTNLISKDPDSVKLGTAIVKEMERQKVLCSGEAKSITDTLKTITKVPKGAKVSDLNIFCRCHRKKIEANKACPKALKLLPKCGGNPTSTLQNLELNDSELASLDLEQESLAEEIVDAVEDVLETFNEFE